MAEPNRLALQGLLDAMPLPPMPEGYGDWEYRDMPVGMWLTDADWDTLFLHRIGYGNFRILTRQRRQMKSGVFGNRGQFFISPAGIANLVKHREAPAHD